MLRDIWTQVFAQLERSSLFTRTKFFTKQCSEPAVDFQQLRWILRNVCMSSGIGRDRKPCTEFFSANGQYVLQAKCSRSGTPEKMLIFGEDEGLFEFNPVYVPTGGSTEDVLARTAASVFEKHGGLLSMLVNHPKFGRFEDDTYMSTPIDWSVLQNLFKDPKTELFIDDGEAVSVIATVLNGQRLRTNAGFVNWFFGLDQVKTMLRQHYDSVIYRTDMIAVLFGEINLMTPGAALEILRALRPEPGIYFRLFVDNIIVPLSRHIAFPEVDVSFKEEYGAYLLETIMPNEVRFSCGFRIHRHQRSSPEAQATHPSADLKEERCDQSGPAALWSSPVCYKV